MTLTSSIIPKKGQTTERPILYVATIQVEGTKKECQEAVARTSLKQQTPKYKR